MLNGFGVRWTSDPNNPDTDGDGLTDGPVAVLEVEEARDPAASARISRRSRCATSPARGGSSGAENFLRSLLV